MDANQIQQLIDKYGQPAWEAAQRQIWIDLASQIAAVAVFVFVAATLWRLKARGMAWQKTVDSFDSDMAFGAVIFGTRIAPGLLLIPAFFTAWSAITILLNPQWAAIQELVSLVPGK